MQLLTSSRRAGSATLRVALIVHCIILAALCFTNTESQASNVGTVLTTTVQATLPIYEPADPVHSQVCCYKGSTYAVTIDPTGRPEVLKISSTGTTSGYIDQPDFTVVDDSSHGGFSIGIDKVGYIHVTGAMHQGYPETINYVARYESEPYWVPTQNILYWRSNKPVNVTKGFTFEGVPVTTIPATGWTTSTSIPGYGWHAGKFITDVNGELYYYSQVDAFNRSAWGQGDRGIGFYHYNTATQTWTAFGGQADPSTAGSIAPYYTMLFWEAVDDGWQNFEATLQFDNSNRLHFATSCDTDPQFNGSPRETRIFYAYSDDSATTWHKASGTLIPGTFLRGDDGQACQMDIVTTNENVGAIAAWTAVTADVNRTPSVGNQGLWYTWNGTAWSTTNALTVSGGLWGTHGKLGASKMFFENVTGANIMWTPSAEQTPLGYQFQGFSQYVCIDEYGLRQTGALYGVGLVQNSGTLDSQAVLKTAVTSAPLPKNWGDTDIYDLTYARHGVTPAFQGFAGYLNGSFIVNDYGYVINNSADDCHFTYTPMTGNCQIVAHLASQVPNNNSLAMSGVMMRETLATGASSICLCLSPTGLAWFNQRLGTNLSSGHYSQACTNQWLKLTRAGSTLTAYTSADGVNWTSFNSATITMASTIYVGLSCAGYSNGGGGADKYAGVDIRPCGRHGSRFLNPELENGHSGTSTCVNRERAFGAKRCRCISKSPSWRGLVS